MHVLRTHNIHVRYVEKVFPTKYYRHIPKVLELFYFLMVLRLQ